MISVGEILRTERETQGRSVAEIAGELCITPSYVRAIEKDDLQSLPGTFFYKSFVKQYATTLGVDEKRIAPGVQTLTSTTEPLPLPGADPRVSTRNPADRLTGLKIGGPPLRDLDPIVADSNRRYFPDRRLGLSLVVLLAVLLGCSGVYAWWTKMPRFAFVREVVSAPPQFTPQVTTQGNIPSSPAHTAPPAVAAVNLTAASDVSGLNRVVLNLSATEVTWLSISSGGKQIFSGILQPAQTKTVSGLDDARIKIGNAGGLEVLWNGKPIGPIGPRGQVRTVLVTPENFQILDPSQTL